MSNVEPLSYPTIDSIMQLARSYVNDTFPGNNQQGRIFTNDAPFTLPLLNSALKELQRRLRNEGVTFPIKDGVIINAFPAVVKADPSVFVSLNFTGSNNGTTTSASPMLPGDCMQPYKVSQRLTGSNLQFTLMKHAPDGLISAYQNAWMGMWEWRGYAIWMNGSLQPQDLMLRYLSGQPPLNVPAASFATTPVYIVDCEQAVAGLMALDYGGSRGANPQAMQYRQGKTDAVIDDMATEYIRRSQTVPRTRISYQGGGSNEGTYTDLGATGTVT
jgi:hypothetical protein